MHGKIWSTVQAEDRKVIRNQRLNFITRDNSKDVRPLKESLNVPEVRAPQVKVKTRTEVLPAS